VLGLKLAGAIKAVLSRRLYRGHRFALSRLECHFKSADSIASLAALLVPRAMFGVLNTLLLL
jgi:hypothetical protein